TIHLQRRADSAYVIGAPLEREGTGPRHHLQTRDTSKGADQLVGEAVGEVFVVGVAAEAGEREYDHAACEWGRRGCSRPHEFWCIAPLGKQNPPAFAGALVLVILFQPFAKAGELDAYDRIGVGVVAGLLSEHRNAQDRLFK